MKEEQKIKLQLRHPQTYSGKKEPTSPFKTSASSARTSNLNSEQIAVTSFTSNAFRTTHERMKVRVF